MVLEARNCCGVRYETTVSPIWGRVVCGFHSSLCVWSAGQWSVMGPGCYSWAGEATTNTAVQAPSISLPSVEMEGQGMFAGTGAWGAPPERLLPGWPCTSLFLSQLFSLLRTLWKGDVLRLWAPRFPGKESIRVEELASPLAPVLPSFGALDYVLRALLKNEFVLLQN